MKKTIQESVIVIEKVEALFTHIILEENPYIHGESDSPHFAWTDFNESRTRYTKVN